MLLNVTKGLAFGGAFGNRVLSCVSILFVKRITTILIKSRHPADRIVLRVTRIFFISDLPPDSWIILESSRAHAFARRAIIALFKIPCRSTTKSILPSAAFLRSNLSRRSFYLPKLRLKPRKAVGIAFRPPGSTRHLGISSLAPKSSEYSE